MPTGLTFSNPALLSGAAAAALPVLIHLVLRPRPRRLRFPALALMKPALLSGRRASRLRNLWLLLVRALLLAVAAALLAGPTCAPSDGATLGDDPISCILVVDDSLSMSYRRAQTNTPLFDDARDRALELLDTFARQPAGSGFGLVWADSGEASLPVSSEPQHVAARLRRRRAADPHATPLGHALRRAAEHLRSAQQSSRQIVVFTDNAEHAWRDVSPAILAGLEDTFVRVVPVRPPRPTNLALTAAIGPTRVHSETALIPIRVTIRSSAFAGRCRLVAERDGAVLQRLGPIGVASDTDVDVTMLLPPLAAGGHAVTVRLEPADRMDFDQQRGVAFETGDRPAVWILTRSPAAAESDLTTLILRNLITPEALEPARQVVDLRVATAADVVSGPENPDASDSTPRIPVLVLVLPGVELGVDQKRTLMRWIENGATALLVPDSQPQAGDWPELRMLLCGAPPTVRSDEVTTLAWEPGSGYEAPDDIRGEFSRCAVRRRLGLGPLADECAILARYADHTPAIISRTLGRGRLVLLTTSPDPAWSELGIRAAPLITWLHQLIAEATGTPARSGELMAGQRSTRVFTALPKRGLVRVSAASTVMPDAKWIRLRAGVPQEPWPSDRAGVYTISTAAESSPSATYAVNWPAEESDLRTADLDLLKSRLGVERVTLDAPGEDREYESSEMLARWLAERSLRPLLAGLLVALFLGELLLANRTQRAPTGHAA